MADEPSSARQPPGDDPERTVLAPTTPGTGTERSQILTQPQVDIELPATQEQTGSAAGSSVAAGPTESPENPYASVARTPTEVPAEVSPTGPAQIPASGTPVTTVPKGAERSSGASSNVLPVGTRLAEFEVISVIGEGGFGIVYRAVDHSLRRIVALKEYMPSALASRLPDFSVSIKSAQHAETFRAGLRSFINEARLLARFDHHALVKVYRFWEANGTAYMVMPMYEGGTLKHVLKDRGRPADEAWLRQLLGPLLDAIELLHKAECLHRDIAPDNVILIGGDASPLRPVLLDFGAARRVITEHTQALTVILKPGFAPIEQYDEIPGMKQGAWTDLYALAAVLHYAMVGKPPPPSVGRMVHDSHVPLVESMQGRYSEVFLAAIDRALAPRPDGRPRSVAEFRALLTTGGPGVGAEPSRSAAAANPPATPRAVDGSASRPVQSPSPSPMQPSAPPATTNRTAAGPTPGHGSDDDTLPATAPRTPARPAASPTRGAVPPEPVTDVASQTAKTSAKTAAKTVANTKAPDPGTSIESLAARWKQHVDKPAAAPAQKQSPAQPPTQKQAPAQPPGADDTLRAMLEQARKDPGRPVASAPAEATVVPPKKLPPWVTPEPELVDEEDEPAPPTRSAAKWLMAGLGVVAITAIAFVFVAPRFGQQQTPATAKPAAPTTPSIAFPAPPPTGSAEPASAAGASPAVTTPAGGTPAGASAVVPAAPVAAAPASPSSAPPVSASPEKVIPPKKKPPMPAVSEQAKAAPVKKTAPMAGAEGDDAAGARPAWMQRALREARECLVARDFACTIQRAETVLASDAEHPAAQRLLKLGRQGQEAALSGDWKMR